MDRKSEIIKATLELASEYGLAAVSMNQIAEKLGISKPALYKHFESREEIIKTMYSFLREQAKQSIAAGEMNLDMLSDKVALEKILTQMVDAYRNICTNPEMFQFYKIIMSQRTIDVAATEIMVMETKAMIDATKKLFYALQVKGLADFLDADAAALSFAMSVHSIIDLECDLNQLKNANNDAGKSIDKNMMKNFISEFCRLYGVKGVKTSGKK